ncbi:dihydrofolate reductase family protein [Halomarina rubra]|uniref:Dihydrofolate reductase family protein n=1 Tax=Halomarina rubra TaxID=2071873 RepID=A0ABD6AQV1_9EURY|nr:dihydrofolate reductase family protein [Halomarina rubra]
MTAGATTLYIATSVDGYVAAEDGGVDWLEAFGGEDSAAAYEAFFAAVDCLVMGATTYEQVLGFGEWPYEERPTVVVTSRDLPRATDAVELYAGDLDALAERLTDEYDHVWLVGGAQLARTFLALGRVDRLRLSVVPVVLGAGVPLFDGDGDRTDLTLLDSTSFESGIVELDYRVVE